MNANEMMQLGLAVEKQIRPDRPPTAEEIEKLADEYQLVGFRELAEALESIK